MTWKPEVDEIDKRKQTAYQMGGEKNVKRQHDHGKLTIRERIDALLDENSFSETGVLAAATKYDDKHNLLSIVPCPIVMGLGTIDDRKVVVHGDDFTIQGASVGDLFKAKLAYIARMAHEMRLPVVRLLDGAGGSIREIAEKGYVDLPAGRDRERLLGVELMSMVPIVSLVLGSVSGIGAMETVESHFSVMVKEKSQVFVGGPPLVQWAMGERISKEELGGYQIHTRISGVVDNEAESEEDAFEQARKFLDYMPANVWEMPLRKYADRDDRNRRDEYLLSAVPRESKKSYDMRKIIASVFDKDSVFE
ncbi:MAG TPA: carboxyl transferase, partial [Desulfobacteraceae bacterium]|nr:carboxyl transferase [Desulfobacteraceae bacterium]